MSKKLPNFKEFHWPILKILEREGKAVSRKEICASVPEFISDDILELRDEIEDGKEKFDGRIGWACTNLHKIEAIKNPKNGWWEITDSGRSISSKEEVNKLVSEYLRSTQKKSHNIKHNNINPIYEAVQNWCDRCLVEDGSVFVEGKELWTIELIDEARQLFVEINKGDENHKRPDFYTILKSQFSDGIPEACQFISECIWFMYLFPPMKLDTKRDTVRVVWSWSEEELSSEHPMLSDSILQSVGAPRNPAFTQLNFRDECGEFLDILSQFKKYDKQERREIIEDPWRFSEWTENLFKKKHHFRHILSHLLFPDIFEPISKSLDKYEILIGYRDFSTTQLNQMSWLEINQELLQLRKQLEPERGVGFSFYDFEEEWRPSSSLDIPKQEDIITVSDDPLNLIFYGPPGTGKTHRVLDKYRSDYDGGDTRRYEFVTFHQSYSYEDFVEGIRPVIPEKTDEKENSNEGDKKEGIAYDVQPGVLLRICERAKQSPDERFALIIDEINRGNITKIFGELITLVEADKRLQYDISSGEWVKGDSSIEVTLPYSGELFGVPSNVDFIGTMNTADRSIALLDSALRRRFEFEEIMPAPQILKPLTIENDSEIDLRKLLEAMNARITRLLHRDQTIGHSYFMKIETFEGLKKVFVRKIIPLLQEAFYNDWRQIRLVFADQAVGKDLQIVRIDDQKTDLFPEADDESFNASDDTFYIADEEDIIPDSIRKIYAPNKYKKSENSEDEDSDDSESDE